MKRIGRALKSFFNIVVRFFAMLNDDQVTVYSAQAAFFIVVSAVPFTILLIGLARYIINIDWLLGLIDKYISGQVGAFLTSVVTEVVDKTGASLVSITLIAVLWSASRGVFSVTRGIAGAYKVRLRENFLLDILRSFIYTLAFIFMIIISLVALVFADTIVDTAREYLPLLTYVMDIIRDCAPIILTVILTLFFAFIYDTVSRKGRSFSKSEYKGLSGKLPRGFLAQLPGAAFAALGWVLFSYFFSLYVNFFPNASYLYGSLATLMLLMLWVYFCMLILMTGAEINKIIFIKYNIEKKHDEYVIKKKRRKKALSRVRTYSSSFGRKKK